MKKIIYLLPILAFSQNIDSIKFKGLIHITKESALNIIKILPHSKYDIKKIDESIKALYNTGYFKDIKADYNNSTLTFICTEKPTILKVSTENISEDLKKLLKEQNLLPKRGEILNQTKLKKLKQFIKSYYLAKGYFNTVVKTEIKYVNEVKVIIKIIVNKGRHVIIRNINFYGATLPKSELEDNLENQEISFFSFLPFFNSGELNIYKLIEDRQKLQDYYLNLGYLDAKVSNPFAKINLDSYFADIDYKIYEGKRYIVKKVTINYPKNIKVKLPKLNLKKDKYFNISALRKDLENIKHAFENEGYAYAKVYPNIKKSQNKVEVIYEVIPGDIVYIRNVIISGNTKTLDRVIRRNVYLMPNKKYSYQDYIDSKYALQRSGYLEDVKIIKKRVSKNKMDILVKVKEGLSGSLRAGISYGSYTKLGFNLAVSEKNVFGSGQSLHINADVNSKSRNYSISLFNPRIFDSKYSFNASIFNSYFEGISYNSKERGFTLGIGKKLNRHLSSNITYGYTNTKLTDYNTTEEIKPKSKKSYIITSFNYDTTDNYFFPTLGKKIAFSIEYAGIGGDEKYIKSIFSYKTFHNLTDKTYDTLAVLKLRAKYGYIKKIGYLPINEKFYLGGLSTVRGFSWYSISPIDKNGNKIGGKQEFIAGPEISTPISKKTKLWASIFLDYGAIGEDNLKITRSSYGIALNWITPMGPISFVWAWPLKSENEDDLQRFEFSIGTSF